MIQKEVTAERPFPFRTNNRTAGLHLYDILTEMRVKLYNERRYPPDDELTEEELFRKKLRFEQGWIFEDCLSMAFGWPFVPYWNDLTMDGILLNPDKRFALDDGFVDEFKFTKKAGAIPPSEDRIWMVQNKAYAYAVSTPDCVYNGRFYVLHVNGDNAKAWDAPTYHCWEYTYCYQELAETWESIINFAKANKLL